jgi:uncharacterized protein
VTVAAALLQVNGYQLEFGNRSELPPARAAERCFQQLFVERCASTTDPRGFNELRGSTSLRCFRFELVFPAADRGRALTKIMGALRVILKTMSDVAENQAVLDDLVRRIAERFSPDRIILFGSRARGDGGPDSDVDLLVLFAEVADPNKRAAELYASLGDFLSAMDIVVSTSSRFERYRNVVNTVYWPASREGKVLYERAA